MTIFRVRRSPMGAIYRSLLGVRGVSKNPTPPPNPSRPLYIWVGWAGNGTGAGFASKRFRDRLRLEIVSELQGIRNAPVEAYRTDGRWIYDIAGVGGDHVVFLFGGRQPSREQYYQNYTCGAQVPASTPNRSIDSLANNRPTQAEAQAWFSANWASLYTRPTIGVSDIGQARRSFLEIDLARYQVRGGDRTVIFLYTGSPTPPSPPRFNYTVWLKAANPFNSNSVISSFSINPGSVSTADIAAGSYKIQDCPDLSTDLSGATSSLLGQIVELNPYQDSAPWTFLGEAFDPETIDAATLNSLVQPHL